MSTATLERVTNTRTVAAQNIRSFSLQAADAVRPDVVVPCLGNVVSTFVDVGSSSTQELTLIMTGLSLSTDVPSTVICQPRQNANEDFQFPDEFNVQVVTTAADQIVVRIRRADSDSGWGQDLRLDLLIFDAVNNP